MTDYSLFNDSSYYIRSAPIVLGISNRLKLAKAERHRCWGSSITGGYSMIDKKFETLDGAVNTIEMVSAVFVLVAGSQGSHSQLEMIIH